MNYSNNPAMVRVDFFKESGKWYATEQMEWLHYKGEMLIHDAFIRSLQAQFNGKYHDMTAICLEPYHEFAHPVMLYTWQTRIPSPLKLT
jgi:hypothetical protein